MKIAIVIERIEVWRGGAEASTMELAHLLARRGHDVHLITASRSPSLPDLTIHMLNVATPIKALQIQAFIRKATAFVSQHRFDIVHSIVPMPEADIYQPRGGAVIETLQRNVATRHTRGAKLFKRITAALNVKQHALLDLERRTCRPGGPVIAAVSGYVADQFRRHYRLQSPRTRVVFNGVEVERTTAAERSSDRAQIRARFDVSPDTLVLLCVAHNFRLKGVARLIDAVARLRERGMDQVVAWIIGRDNPVPFQRQALRGGVADRIVFIGPTPRVAAFFHAADICVHPTYYDPCSRVVLEALARGVPPITTRHNGAAEVMEDGRHGFILNSADDVEGLVDRIGRLSEGRARREFANAAAALGPRLSMTRHVSELISLYEEISAARHARA